jgi:hypothetical protein
MKKIMCTRAKKNFRLGSSGAHTYISSYLGDRDQEDQGSEPVGVNSSQDLFSKKLITKKGLVEWLK